MDIKSDRRNFYQNKTFLSNKYDKDYTAQKFPDDLQYMLDEYIPNANQKQLRKFMLKKYNRVVKSYPEVQKALRKVLKDKLNSMLAVIKKSQLQKMLSFISTGYDNMQLVQNPQNTKEYSLIPQKKQKHPSSWTSLRLQGLTIKLPQYVSYQVDTTQKDQTGVIKITCLHPYNRLQRNFVSAEKIDLEKFYFKKGNFQKEVNSYLDKLEKVQEMIREYEN